VQVSADLYVEVQTFYAKQMPLLEEGRVDEFAAMFSPDAVVEHPQQGWRLEGRDAIADGSRAGLERYGDSTIRHWFESRLVEPEADGTVRVRSNAIVSLTDPQGVVTFEPSCTVRDVLVRRDGVLYTQSRVMRHDTGDPTRVWAGQFTA
jgi:actinorhodin biosynthesis protein ActVIA